MRITDVLLGEHGAMYPLLDYIENTAGESGVKAAFLRSALLSHADLEDSLLKPVILSFLPKPNVGPTDHEVIAAKLQNVVNATVEKEAREQLLDVVRDIRKHFRKEESIVFPLADGNLTTSQQSTLVSEWARSRGLEITCR